MKVKVQIELDVDPRQWASRYGLLSTAADVREDVGRYVTQLVEGGIAVDGVPLTVLSGATVRTRATRRP